ncbi:MAG TPA: hypothetical protein VIT67_04250, partial [Povalibacter sp.]
MNLRYCMYDLGTGLEIVGINNRNQIAGSAVLPGDSVQGFVWQWHKGIRLLGLLPGAAISVAYDINDLGQVVGASGSGAYIWGPRTGMRAISELGTAWHINNAGQIVGYGTTANGLGQVFRDRDGEMQDVGPGFAFGLTNYGVLGLNIQSAHESEMFFWNKRTGPHLVPNFPEPSFITFPEFTSNALSDRLEVVAAANQGTTFHAIRWTRQSGMQDLGTLTGAGYSAASAV